jgi:hypothetical protein
MNEGKRARRDKRQTEIAFYGAADMTVQRNPGFSRGPHIDS